MCWLALLYSIKIYTAKQTCFLEKVENRELCHSYFRCGLPEKILKILEKRDYDTPFPIQMQVRFSKDVVRFAAQPDVSFYATIHQLPGEIALFTGFSLGVICRF